MSVADKLEKLTTDINSAYTAIEEKGGTIPEHKNTENLSSAIGSISGGGYDDKTDWGVIYYWSETILNIENISADMCTAEIVDEDLFKQAVESLNIDSAFNLDFNFQQGEGWTNWELSEEPMSTADLLNYGIKVTDFDEETAEYAFIMINGEMIPNMSIAPVRRVLETEEEFMSFRDDGSGTKPWLVPMEKIQKIVIGESVTSLPNYWMNRLQYIEEIDTTYAGNVTTIGNNVFKSGSDPKKAIVKDITFPNVTSVGDSCFSFPSTQLNRGFLGELSLPECLTVGKYFAEYSKAIPSLPKLETTGDYFMAYFQQTGMYMSSFPKLKTLGRRAFAYSNIKTLSLNINSLTSIGGGFCQYCTGLVDVNIFIDPTIIEGDFSAGDAHYSFGNQSNTAVSYLAGMNTLGNSSYITSLKNRFVNSSSGGCYRKWR